jgi:hypothetical protein
VWLDEYMVTLRICRDCRTNKPLSEFNRSRRHNNGYNSRCKVCSRAYVNQNRATRPEAVRKRQRELYSLRRMRVINHYGGKCACCLITEPVFLTVDHYNDDGSKHRDNLPFGGTAGVIYNWIIKNEFPATFQILCFNCNYAKAHGGCPHNNEAN